MNQVVVVPLLIQLVKGVELAELIESIVTLGSPFVVVKSGPIGLESDSLILYNVSLSSYIVVDDVGLSTLIGSIPR